MSAGDIVIAEPWAFQDDKAHVVRRYDASEARRLLACGELPPGTRIGPLLSVDEELLRRHRGGTPGTGWGRRRRAEGSSACVDVM